MKKTTLIVVATTVAMLFGACKSNNKITQQDMGNREVVLPCANFDRDTEEYFAASGIGENVNMQNARLAALNGAKSMINAKIGGVARGIVTDYMRTMAGQAQQDDVQRVAEGEVVRVIERVLNDAEQVCEKMYQTPNGTYQSHIAIRISKADMAQSMATALSDNQKLETLFNREQFRRFAEEYMKGLKQQ